MFTLTGLNAPNTPVSEGIMRRKRSRSPRRSCDAGSAGGSVGLGCEPELPARQGGRIIDGASVQEKVTKLVDALRNEAKVL